MTRVRRIILWGAMLATTPSAVAAQSVERLVAGAADGAVQLHFAARDGVCGDGRSFYRSGAAGSYISFDDGTGGESGCLKGPVRAVLVRAGREIVRIETYAGPIVSDPDGGTDLGSVSARAAAAYLMDLAATLDGRPAREALQAAMLADSAVVTPQLVGLVRDSMRARDVRGSAISWLARRRAEPGGVGASAAQRALDAIVRDRDESALLRRQALMALGSFDQGEGVPLLLVFAADTDRWIAAQAMQSLANSGDPRARQFLRAAVRRPDLPDESRVAAIRGIGDQYAMPADYQLLRALYPAASSDQIRNAIINVLASAGGSANTAWLVALARSPTEPASRRRQAVAALARTDDPRVNDVLKALTDH